MKATTFDLLHGIPALPVVAFQKLEQAVPITRALNAGGLRAIEVTLRTECALDAIYLLSREVPEALIGAGTIADVGQLRAVKAAGAKFAISPGLTMDLLRSARDIDMPYLPGVATASEIMSGLSQGYTEFKFFPASAAGGPNMLKAWAAPFPDVVFCPTGGIDPGNLGAYLALPNVRMVGSSWMLPGAAIANGDWHEVETRARSFVTAIMAAKTGSTSV